MTRMTRPGFNAGLGLCRPLLNNVNFGCPFSGLNYYLLCGLHYLADSYNAKMVCFGEGTMSYAGVKI